MTDHKIGTREEWLAAREKLLEREQEEIFPDPMSESMAESWRTGPVKELERQNADPSPHKKPRNTDLRMVRPRRATAHGILRGHGALRAVGGFQHRMTRPRDQAPPMCRGASDRRAGSPIVRRRCAPGSRGRVRRDRWRGLTGRETMTDHKIGTREEWLRWFWDPAQNQWPLAGPWV